MSAAPKVGPKDNNVGSNIAANIKFNQSKYVKVIRVWGIK